MKSTVQIEAKVFETSEGEKFLDFYEDWKKQHTESADIKKRRDKLVASGLIRQAPAKIEGGLKPLIVEIFDEQDGLTLEEITGAVNESLKAFGKPAVLESQVKSTLNFYCCDNTYQKDTKDGKYKKGDVKNTGFLKREGEDEDTIYKKKEAKVDKKKEKK